MTKQERALYERMRDVPVQKALAASKAGMDAMSERQFREENAIRAASTSRTAPVYSALRDAIASRPEFAGVMNALKLARSKPDGRPLEPIKAPPSPKVPRLRLGSMHLVDTPPFQAQTWQACSFSGGNESVSDDVPNLSADGSSGNMSFTIEGGGLGQDNASSVSCWSAVGQAYTFPAELLDVETGGALLRFSANPSFTWSGKWSSNWWRLASGNIWIGQVVNRFDQNWVFLDNPVVTQTSLISWNDYNFADQTTQSAESSAFGLTSWVFVQPNFNYFAWVWMGASAFGDTLEWTPGFSSSEAKMNATCSQIILDTF